jgi:hypothetical protein
MKSYHLPDDQYNLAGESEMIIGQPHSLQLSLAREYVYARSDNTLGDSYHPFERMKPVKTVRCRSGVKIIQISSATSVDLGGSPH